jgi:type II secretory pathway pseudopilin PulG
MLTSSTACFSEEGNIALTRGQPGRAFGGFVLVEVIVVAVIVGIISAVAIPVYLGMIKTQRRQVTQNIAQSAAVSANIYYRRYGFNPTCGILPPTCSTVLGIFLPDPNKYEVSVQGNYVVVVDVSKGVTDSVQSGVGFR